MAVLDSSFLVTLEAINGIDLLLAVKGELICPKGVYDETVGVGLTK